MKCSFLFVNPWIHDFAAYDFWAKPLGLMYLAAILRENGIAINFIDCLNPYHPELHAEPGIIRPKRKPWGNGQYPKEHIEKPSTLRSFPRRYSRYGISPALFKGELLTIERPDLVFVTSMMTYWYPGVFETIAVIREALPGVPVVLGGNYATHCTSHAKAFSGADLVIPGEGERTVSDLIYSFTGVRLDTLPDEENLDTYPYPAFDLISVKDQLPLITSRGCPFHCVYCATPLSDKGFRCRDPICVFDEIEHWHRKYGVMNFAFYDDALLVNSKERAVPMMREILERDIRCTFHCPNGLHLREIDETVSVLMHRSGFKTVRFGFETSDVIRQKESGGKVTNDETREAISHLRRAGYRTEDIGAYILCGLPGQAADEVRESIMFIKSCGARPIIAEFSPIPGTPIWEDAVAASPYPIAEEPLFQNNTLLPCGGDTLTYEEYQELKRMTRETI